MMQNEPRFAAELNALEACLDVHGPDVARWPQAAQQRFAPLLRESPAAQQKLREASALERLVRASSPPDPQRLQRLNARVMQAAAAIGAPRDHPALEPKAFAVVPQVQVRQAPRLLDTRARLALAASLLLGIVIGASGLPDTAWTPGQPAQMVSGGQTDEDELAFGAATGEQDVEDFL